MKTTFASFPPQLLPCPLTCPLEAMASASVIIAVYALPCLVLLFNPFPDKGAAVCSNCPWQDFVLFLSSSSYIFCLCSLGFTSHRHPHTVPAIAFHQSFCKAGSPPPLTPTVWDILLQFFSDLLPVLAPSYSPRPLSQTNPWPPCALMTSFPSIIF